MKILVTGGSGFLGKALCRALAQDRHEVIAPDSKSCDLTRAESLLPLNGTRCDRIYHLAAWTQAGDFCLYHPGEQWIINQQINTNVLNWWRVYQPHAKLVSIGTSCCYDPALALKEGNYLLGTPVDSLFTYAMTKRMLYVGQMALHRQFGLFHLTVVPSTIYGPGYHSDGRQMHFIFDLVRKILRGALYGETPVLWGDGRQRRELVYIDDFVTILRRLADDRENDLVNIGAGEEHEIREFARMICEQVGYDPERIQFDQTRYVGAKSKCLDTAKLRALYQDLCLTPLDVGLKRTIEWFLANREKCLPEVSCP